jgi:hypothetical protein
MFAWQSIQTIESQAIRGKNRQDILTYDQAGPIILTSTHVQVLGLAGHPADNYELTCHGQGSGYSGLCADRIRMGELVYGSTHPF